MQVLQRFAAILVLLVISSSSSFAEGNAIKFGTDASYPPFNYLGADGVQRGYEVDMINAMCVHLDLECEFVITDWTELVPALQSGKIDAIVAAMSITDERLRIVDFSVPYLKSPPLVVSLRDGPIGNMEIPERELRDLTIGVQSASTHANYVSEVVKAPKVKEYPSQDDMKLDLQYGRVDVIVDSAVSLSDWLKGEGAECCRVVGRISLVEEIHGRGAGIALRKEDTELKAKIDKALTKILSDGTMEGISLEYFDAVVF